MLYPFRVHFYGVVDFYAEVLAEDRHQLLVGQAGCPTRS